MTSFPLRVAWIDADGIGAEIGPVARLVLTTLAPDIEVVDFDLGAERYLRDGTTLPTATLEDWRDNYGAIYLGPVGDPRVPSNVHAKAMLLDTRFGLDLYINQRPTRVFDPSRSPLKDTLATDVNFVVFRENTEDCYVGIGGTLYEGTNREVAQETCIATYGGTRRIVVAAFEYAKANGLTNVCYSTKANAMPKTGTLWHRVVKEVSANYPGITVEHEFIDILCFKMIMNPRRYRVIVTSNLFGDIITDLAAGVGGSMGLAASGNIHPGKVSLFQPVHGSAPDIAGQGVANPFAAILSVGMMLTHFGRPELEQRIIRAVQSCVLKRRVTKELGGSLSTQEAGAAFLEELEAA